MWEFTISNIHTNDTMIIFGYDYMTAINNSGLNYSDWICLNWEYVD